MRGRAAGEFQRGKIVDQEILRHVGVVDQRCADQNAFFCETRERDIRIDHIFPLKITAIRIIAVIRLCRPRVHADRDRHVRRAGVRVGKRRAYDQIKPCALFGIVVGDAGDPAVFFGVTAPTEA